MPIHDNIKALIYIVQSGESIGWRVNPFIDDTVSLSSKIPQKQKLLKLFYFRQHISNLWRSLERTILGYGLSKSQRKQLIF